MITHPTFLLAFISLVVLGYVHVSASTYFWYWHYPWLDTGVHFLAGLSIGFLISWLLVRQKISSRQQSLYIAIIAALTIGILWELFEYSIGIPRALNYHFDTSLDILMDVLGVVLANLFSRRFLI